MTSTGQLLGYVRTQDPANRGTVGVPAIRALSPSALVPTGPGREALDSIHLGSACVCAASLLTWVNPHPRDVPTSHASRWLVPALELRPGAASGVSLERGVLGADRGPNPATPLCPHALRRADRGGREGPSHSPKTTSYHFCPGQVPGALREMGVFHAGPYSTPGWSHRVGLWTVGKRLCRAQVCPVPCALSPSQGPGDT